MGLVINTNNASIAGQRNLFWTQDSQATTFKRLATGLRINSAKDDAAGSYITTTLTRTITGQEQANRNAGDGIAYLQTAEGAMDQILKLSNRISDLMIQGANDPNNKVAKQLGDEAKELFSEMERIMKVTEFNGQMLIDGSTTAVNLQVGFNNKTDDQIKITSISVKSALSAAAKLKNVSTTTDAKEGIALVKTLIEAVAKTRATAGAAQRRLEASISNGMSYVENAKAARSRIEDTDYASETANLARLQVLQQAGMAVLSQSNAATQNILGLLR